MAYIYPLNNPGGVHLTIFYFTHLAPPPNNSSIFSDVTVKSYDTPPYINAMVSLPWYWQSPLELSRVVEGGELGF